MATAINIDTAKQMAFEEMTQLKERIIANMQAAGAVASGHTIRSLAVVATDDGVALVSQQQMPFWTLEKGRAGGATPRGFADIIYEWMKVKGIHGDPIPYLTDRQHKYSAQERGDRSLAWAISKSIKSKGTKLFQKGGRDTIYSQEIPKTIEAIQTKLSALLQSSVARTIEDEFKEYRRK